MPSRNYVPPSPSPPLTPELLLRIFEHVYYLDPALDRTPDYRTLRTASLVCSDWAVPAQTLLYRYVRITHKYRAHSFLRITGQKTEKSRVLRESVRKLYVTFKDPMRNKKLKLSNEEFMYLVQNCPYLYELVVAENPEPIGPDIADGLRAGAPVRALRLLLVTDMDRMLELVQIWPTIQFLEALPPKPLDDSDPMMASEEFKLRELRLHVSYDLAGTFATHIAPSFSQLNTLALTRGSLKPDALKAVLGHARATLRSLTVESWDDPTSNLVRGLPKLQELILWGHIFRCSLPLLDTLPTTLVHLGFYVGGSQEPRRLERERSVIGGIKNKLPELTTITSYNYLGVREREWATPFVRYCRMRGIRIREFATGGGEAPVDLVPTKTYPRPLTTRNFDLMRPLPQIVERQRLIDYTSPPPVASGSRASKPSFSGSRKSISRFGKRLFSGNSGSRDEYSKYEKLD